MVNQTGGGMILVVEKDPRFAVKFKKHLRVADHRVFYVESGQDALFLLDSISADFLLINLNGIESWENLKKLILYSRENQVPLLFIEGLRRTQSVVDRLKGKGFKSFISLPFSVQKLSKRITGMLRGPDPLIGLKLGPAGQEVEIVKKLGSGAMGSVYKAYQASLERSVAVKFLAESLVENDPEAGTRFQHEARAIAKMRSTYIVQIFFVGRYQGRPYLVMEYIEGPNLEKYLAGKGALKPCRALEITREILLGLGEAHGREMVHRDMKPANIMLNQGGHAIILDFGLVRQVDSSNMTKAGSVLGTPRYMSPEQVNGQQVDARCDLYSLGIILYEMLVGSAPFQGKDFVSILMKHINQPLPRPETFGKVVEDDLYAIVEKLTQKKPEDRYASAQEALSDVDDCLRQKRTVSEPESDTLILVNQVKPIGGLAVNEQGATIMRFGEVEEHRDQHLHLLDSLFRQLGDLGELGDFRRGMVTAGDLRLVVFNGFDGLAAIETRAPDLTTRFNMMSIEDLRQFFEKEAVT